MMNAFSLAPTHWFSMVLFLGVPGLFAQVTLPVSELTRYDGLAQKTVPRMDHTEEVFSFLETQGWYRSSEEGFGFEVTTVKTSLLGKHVHIQQTIGGHAVYGSSLVVSLDHENRLMRTYASGYLREELPTLEIIQKESGRMEDREGAGELSWRSLKSKGDLRAPAEFCLQWVKHRDVWRLAHRVRLSLSHPAGIFQVLCLPDTGEVLDIRELIHPTKHHHDVAGAAKQATSSVTSAHASFAEAERAMWQRFATPMHESEKASSSTEDGQATLFVPDPRTTLREEDLRDNSPDSAFTDAYRTVTLKDLTRSGDLVRLEGPYCQIVNLESPNSAPSTTTDGKWLFQRGDLAFYDAMCYFHIDTSQRYLQSIGFTGNKALQDKPLRVDSNGVYGDDNSYYDITNDFLSFGHGGVPDNEDADVIIHEYGHAIHFQAAPSFFGGDTGAIAEGFSDYWAASYRLMLEHGSLFFPNWVFHWDGHSSSTWPGRVLDAYELSYDSFESYSAHQWLGNNRVSDELWSTPIFQTLLSAMKLGKSKEAVDRIIVEALFGLGYGTRISQQAEAVVDVAERLYPGEPYADLFRAHFRRHGMLPMSADRWTYYNVHMPPASDDPTAWQSQTMVFNPGTLPLNVQAATYEADTQGAFQLIDTEAFFLAAGASTEIEAPGSLQRWMVLTSDGPLSGRFTFFRTTDPDKTQERVTLPLSRAEQAQHTLILPHIPRDRVNFWSGAALLNPGSTVAQLRVEPISKTGLVRTDLLTDQVKTQLQPKEKWISFLSDGWFVDTHDADPVEYILVHSSQPLLGFELFGYQLSQNTSATSGIAAGMPLNAERFVARVDLDRVDWTGLSLLNSHPTPYTCTLSLRSGTGASLGQLTYDFPALTKKLALYDRQAGFVFPYNDVEAPLLQLSPNQGSVAFLEVTSALPLTLFELAGDQSGTSLDGTAVWPVADRLAFAYPKGVFHGVLTEDRATVRLLVRDENGAVLVDQSNAYNAWQRFTFSLDNLPEAASLLVTGKALTGYVVDQDEEEGSLSISASVFE
jgi:hypothetical protein